MEHLPIYTFLYICGTARSKQFSQKKQRILKRTKRMNALIEDYMKNTKENKDKEKKIPIFFVRSISHLTSACARRCVPFHLPHVFAINDSRESFRLHTRTTSMFIFCGCILSAGVNNKRKKKRHTV